MKDYLPKRETELKAFALNFAAKTTATPSAYGLVANDATQISDAAQDFADKLDLATSPAGCIPANVELKNQAKDVLVAILRGYAMQIKNNRAVSNADKINLGIGVYDGNKAPV